MPVSMLSSEKACALETLGRSTPKTDFMPPVLCAIRKQLMLDTKKTERQVDKRMDDFINVVNHIARSLNTTPECLTVSEVVENEMTFLVYLSGKKLAPQTKAQLPSTRNALLRHARNLGFSPRSFALLDEWEPIKAALPAICSVILQNAIERNRRPIEFCNADVSVWANTTLDAGRQHVYVRNVKSAFLTGVRKSGLQSQLPQLDVATRRLPPFSVRVDDMPFSLSDEIGEIVESRRERAELGFIRMSRITASNIVDHFEEVIGYAIRIREMKNLDSIRPLLVEPFMMDFAFFLHDDRKCSRATVVGRLGRMFSTIKCSPAFEGVDLSWAPNIYSKLLREPESALKGRRRKRFMAFQKLAVVPEQMRIKRAGRSHGSPQSLGWRIRDELLLSFLILAQYPPHFVREAVLGVNLFKAPIPHANSHFKIPDWVHDVLKEDPSAEFWQFYYQSRQGEVFRGLVLRQIVPLLDLYISHCRPLLIGSSVDPGNVFFTRSIAAYSSGLFGQHVGNLTRRYAGKYVTPKAIQSSFVYRWREKFGAHRDATLAKIQWVQFETIKMRYDDEYRKQRAMRVQRRNNRYA